MPDGGLLRIPNNEPNRMTKTAETRRPIRPSNSLFEVHARFAVDVAAAADAAAADVSVSRATTLATTCTPSILPTHWVALSSPRGMDAISQGSDVSEACFSIR